MSKPKFIVVDVETTGIDPHVDKLHGVGLCWEEDQTIYIPYIYSAIGYESYFAMLADPEIAKVGHNIRFDLKFLAKAGIEVAGPLHDTMLLASLVNENRPLGLKELTTEIFGKEALQDKSSLDSACRVAGVKHVGELCKIDLESSEKPYLDIIARYCEEDCNNTYKLFLVLSKQLRAISDKWKASFPNLTATPLDYYKVEAQPLEQVLLSMEQTGLAIAPAKVEAALWHYSQESCKYETEFQEACQDEIQAIEDELFEEAKAKRVSEKGKAAVERHSEKYGTRFNYASGEHLSRLFFDRLACPVGLVNTTKSGKRSVAEADLFRIADLTKGTRLGSVLEIYAKYKKTQKFLSTYIGDQDKGLLSHVRNGRIYAGYNSGNGPVTGRLSSNAPNMQNLPRSGPVKSFFVPTPAHKFIYFDYSQVELRIAAHLSQDKELINAYLNNLDLHAITAATIFGKDIRDVKKEERQIGKTFNFALIYDAAAYRLWEELSSNGSKYSIEDCDRMRKAFFDRYKGYKAFLGRVKRFTEQHACIISETGRVRRLPEIKLAEGLNWQTKTWQGPRELNALLTQPGERISEQERFTRAKKKYKHALKQAYNFPIQSLGASITKRAMIQLHEAGFKLVATVHDSIVLEVHESKLDSWRFAQKVLENGYKLRVPLVAEKKLLNSLEESDTINFVAQNVPQESTKGAQDESSPRKFS